MQWLRLADENSIRMKNWDSPLFGLESNQTIVRCLMHQKKNASYKFRVPLADAYAPRGTHRFIWITINRTRTQRLISNSRISCMSAETRLLKLITEENWFEVCIARTACRHRQIGFSCKLQRENCRVECNAEEGRRNLAANRQQYAENEISIYQFKCAKNQLKTGSHLLTSACRQWIANSNRRWRQQISRIYFCVHIIAVAACVFPTDDDADKKIN